MHAAPSLNAGMASRGIPRRSWFGDLGSGLAGAALAQLLSGRESRGEAALPAPHFPPRVRRIIHVFCPGGVSHVDTFDHKPELRKQEGKELVGKGKIDTFFGQPGTIMPSPFEFQRHGESGAWVSSLLPNLARNVDDMTFIHSMVARSSNHTPATFQMNTGFTFNGFPSIGSWVSYGLGSENENLPAFVVLPDPRGLPAGGAINWTQGFLPAVHQGVALRSQGPAIVDLETPQSIAPAARQASLRALERMNRDFLAAQPSDSTLAARIRSYELAAQMQLTVPEVTDIAGETAATQALYGVDHPVCGGFARNCLLARRLIERGVRYVQLFHGGAFGSPRINWDAHEDIVDNHTKQAAVLDQPIAALLQDLLARGLFSDTLLVCTTEFGRTPITQGLKAKGRDHHPNAFTVWLAGAGVRPGFAHGATDEVGYSVARDPVTIYDLHATILFLLGLDHRRLTYYHNGIERRLTDVHGEVVSPILSS